MTDKKILYGILNFIGVVFLIIFYFLYLLGICYLIYQGAKMLAIILREL